MPRVGKKFFAFRESKTLTEWSNDDRCVVKYPTLYRRVVKYKWSLEKSLTTKLRKTPKSIAGQKFGKLTAVSKEVRGGKDYWRCDCECGEDTVVSVHSLLSGHTKSCGCFLKEAAIQNGKARTIGVGLAARNSTLRSYKTRAKKKGI